MIFTLFTSISYAASPVFYRGYAFLDGATAANGTIIQAFLNNASTAASGVTIGEGILAGVTPQGRYVISFEANSGDNVTFKINGAALVAMNGTNTTAQTILSGQIVVENFNLSANRSANTVACTFASGCSGGFCVHSICRAASTFCGDAFCDTGESCSSDDSACSSGQACTSGCQTTSTSSTGGGGGGGAVTTPTVTETTAPQTVSAGSTATFTISAANVTSLSITEIDLNATETITAATITIKETTKPAEASVAISSAQGTVYKYLDITSSFPSTKISDVKIQFKVPKSWFTSNSVVPEATVLKKLVNNQWVSLPTQKLSFDGTNYTFEAVTTSFSVYAITSSKKVSFFDVIGKIDQYYKGGVNFFDVVSLIDLYYKS